MGVNFPASGIRECFQKIITQFIHARSLKRAGHIIAISDATRKDAIALFHVPEKKITTVYLGSNSICAISQEEIRVPENFFLFVGAIKERKNVLNIVHAFRLFLDTRSDFSLVLLGKGMGEYYERIQKYIKEEGIEKNIIFLPGHLSDNVLSYLYQNARALLYPSIIEGFGFPILEAMSCGLPVITSRVSSLPELAGDAALYVDHLDPESIMQGMRRIVEDSHLRQDLIERGFAQVENFSWEQTAERYLEILKRL